MFNQFPKIRPELPAEFKEIYADYYRKNREGETSMTSIAVRLEEWMHRKVAADVQKNEQKLDTLELGAGTLNHLRFEECSCNYDIVEPFEKLYKGSSRLSRVRNIYSDINDISDNKKYDRIVSIATFEHLLDLPKITAKCGLLLNSTGSLRIGIPNEGHMLWRLGQTVSTGLEFRIKYNLNYRILIQHEHVNVADEIEDVLKYFYRDVKCNVFGLSKRLSLYRFYECKTPILDRCKEFLGDK